jgi:hypothetical protein
MAARVASGNGALGQLVRAQQDALVEQRGIDKAVIEEVGKPAEQRVTAREGSLRNRLNELEQRLGELNVRIGSEFPDYAELVRSKPLEVAGARQLLQPDEALLFFLTGERESHVFALTRERLEWRTLPFKRAALASKVSEFRRGLDVDVLRRGLARLECAQAQADQRGLARIDCGQMEEPRGELFDLGCAHELYAALIGPVEAVIADKRHLVVVPSGSLTALPFICW